MAGYIHNDISEILQEAATSNDGISTVGWSPEQLNDLNVMLQYAWNRGYKSGCQDTQNLKDLDFL